MSRAQELIKKAQKDGRTLLTLDESRTVLEEVGLPLTKMSFASSAVEAGKLAAVMGFPLAMKISSPDVVHKSDVGGVILNINDEFEAQEAFEQIVMNVDKNAPGAQIDGVVIDEMVKGPELIIGLTIDPQFGPMVMFGIGGTLVEVYHDVTFRLVPLTERDALEMMEEIKGQGVLDGARKMPAVDRKELAKIILGVASVFEKFPQVSQVDVNPLVITKDGLKSVDARVVL